MPAADQQLYWLHALSPLHVGTGRGEGYIDLPLAREKVTRLPFVPGSAVKGVFADCHGASQGDRRNANPIHVAAFGSANGDNSNAGALVFTDARLVCLPVRSVYGTFAWCTSRFVLRRLARDYDAAGFTHPAIPPELPALSGSQSMFVQVATKSAAIVHDGNVYLEDLDGKTAEEGVVLLWANELSARMFPTKDDAAWRKEFVNRFAVLPDDIFNSLCETGTEVQAHVRIESEFKRVADGALWYEESLPAEAVLAGFVWCDAVRGVPNVTKQQILDLCVDRDGPTAVQLGGKATVGKGRTRLLFSKGA